MAAPHGQILVLLKQTKAEVRVTQRSVFICFCFRSNKTKLILKHRVMCTGKGTLGSRDSNSCACMANAAFTECRTELGRLVGKTRVPPSFLYLIVQVNIAASIHSL